MENASVTLKGLFEPEFGARLSLLMAMAPPQLPSVYPLEREVDAAKVQFSIRLSKENHAELKLMAELWNAFDEALEKDDSVSWKVASVVERLVAVGIDNFWKQVGGRPGKEKDREDFVRQAIARLKTVRSK